MDEQSKHLEDFSSDPQECAYVHFSPLRHPSSVPQKRHGALSPSCLSQGFCPSFLSQGFCPSPDKALTAGFPCVSTGANAGGFDGVAYPATWALASSSNSAWIYSAQSFTGSQLGARSTSSCWRMDASRKATWLPPSFAAPAANFDRTLVSTRGSIVTRNSPDPSYRDLRHCRIDPNNSTRPAGTFTSLMDRINPVRSPKPPGW